MMKRKLVAQGEAEVHTYPSHAKDRSMYYRMVLYAAVMAVSIVIPRTSIYGGLSPFGVSLIACVEGPACIMVSIGTAVGYLLVQNSVMPLRYIAAMICVIAFQWALGGSRKITTHALYSPCLAGISVFVTGVALNSVNGFQWEIFLVELFESVICAGAAYFFKTAIAVVRYNHGPRTFDMRQQAALMITAAIVLCALNTIVIGEVSVGRVLTMVVILLAARAGQQQGGTLVGVAFGAVTAICAPTYAHLSAGYSFGGLLAGIFSRFGRAMTAAVFLVVNMIVAVSMGEAEIVIVSIYETLLAATIFMVLPSVVERASNTVFSRAESLPTAEGLCRSVTMRLQYSADALSSVAKTVDAVSEKLSAMNAPDLKEVYAGVCERVCNGCKRRNICWKREFTDTMAVFRSIGDTLRREGEITNDQLPESFQRQCHHVGLVLSTVNHGYSRFIIKENAYRRLKDIRGIATDQFEGMASLLRETADNVRLSERADIETATRIEQLCEQYRIPLRNVLCSIGKRNRLTVDLLVEGQGFPNEKSRFFKELCNTIGCELAPPTVIDGEEITKVHITEKNRFQIAFSAAQLNCRCEKLCGDSYEMFYDHEGCFCVVLSDGMGSGGRAAVDGAMTSALASQMMQAGFCYENILRMINSALIVKSTDDESLSTLDILRIDLMNGYMHGLKAGAAPTFLYSSGRVVRIVSSSLPIGILREVETSENEDYIKKGDVIVMISDGVASDDTQWLEELIAERCKEDVDEESLANEIVFYAREKQDTEHTDDTTALVMKVQ